LKCSEVRAFLTQVTQREKLDPNASIPSADVDYLSANGYILKTSKGDYDNLVDAVGRLSQMTDQRTAQRLEVGQEMSALRKDEQKEHSFLFHLEGKESKEELSRRIQDETAVLSKEEAELNALEANVNELIQKKSMVDRMVPYGDAYLSLTGLGTVTLNDLNVRDYRVADEDIDAFVTETKSIYIELQSIAERASSYTTVIKPKVDSAEGAGNSDADDAALGASSLLWSTAIGLAKLQGDPNQIEERFTEALDDLSRFQSTTSNKRTAAEIMTALSNQGQDLQGLESALETLDRQLRDQGVPKQLSAGVAATIMAGRRFDGTYPMDRFEQFGNLTSSHEARAILSVMNLPYEDLSSKFQQFKSMFTSWGFINSDDTEIGAAFLAIGELRPEEVEGKVQYIVEQLRNYLEYPLVAAAILASIPVFESHEVLDLMEKSVTILTGYAAGLERSELVALAVRMVHGVRNEIVKEIDPTAKFAETPVQFTYAAHPGFFWYYPLIVTNSAYHATFTGMGGFHPAHSHGVGGFAG